MKITSDNFISVALSIHLDKYDYTNSVYINNTTKLSIRCKTCDHKWMVIPYNHIGRKSGCPKCAKKSAANKTRRRRKSNKCDKTIKELFDDYLSAI